MMFRITIVLIDVNAAQSKLVLLENFNKNYSKCLRLLVKLLLLEEVTTARRSSLLYKVNTAEGVNAASEEVSTAELVIAGAVEKRFGRNEATKKTQRNLLKQQYKNFTAPSSQMLDHTFDRIQKLVSQLELQDEKILQEDVEEGPNYALMAYSSSSSDSEFHSPLTGNFRPPIPGFLSFRLDGSVNKPVVENDDCSGCSRHMTGNMSYLTDYEEIDGGYVAFGGNPKEGKSRKRLPLKLLIDESQVLLRVPRKNNMYSVDLKNIVPKGGLTFLFAKATSDESKLWHRRLGHLNFKTMNKLVKENLVRGLPSKLFENDQTCVACQKGKQHRASCKSKTENSISLPLHLLHMDLFGPTFVKSLMKKMYCLVVTDDYSRFTWVFFLATKDETSGILKSFITGIENLVDHKVKVIRCDNGTEFKNREMNQFCEMKGILRQFSVARTPQQNGVAERRNRTLIEAARTMLADSKLPTTFWAEAVNTACYVQNRVLVVKPHNKTPYELFHGRTPTLSFMRPFGCPVTILNTIDHLGKFDGKADEGFFVGYSLNSKAFRVFNSRTRIVEENLHIRFSESTPNVVGSGPDWLFDIDALTRTMNYEPIVAGTQSNGFAGTKASDNAGQARKETEPVKDYILLPLWTADPPYSQDPKSSHDDGSKPSSDDGKKVDVDPRKDSECKDQGEGRYVNNITLLMLRAQIKEWLIGDLQSVQNKKGGSKNLKGTGKYPNKVIHALKDPSWIEAIQEELLQFKLQEVWTLVDLTNEKRAIGPVTTEEKAQKKNHVKARSMLLMALPNKHQLTFNQYKDAKTLFAAIQTRFGGNDATKKTQKTLLKQSYENFNAPNVSHKYGLCNQLLASSINEVNTANVQVSTANSSVSNDSTFDCTNNLSDATVYAFLANQPNGSQLVHEDLEQIHEDDLEEMDFKWQLALLSMRARKYYQRTGNKITINGSDTAGYDKSKVECFNCHKMGHFARECRGPKN
ncbi:putative ribonuclease H-like domain-containing protein [Tanacetum coccineum]